jgi:acetate kinase
LKKQLKKIEDRLNFSSGLEGIEADPFFVDLKPSVSESMQKQTSHGINCKSIVLTIISYSFRNRIAKVLVFNALLLK